MNRIPNFLSLLLVCLMLVGASITVNKAVFGYDLKGSGQSERSGSDGTDSIAALPDGGVVIHTAAMSKTINGYAGQVPLDIYISDGKISDIKALPNAETPSFFNRASALFASWIGKTPEEAVNMQVDAVSGATYSSAAIINNVNTGLDAYLGSEGKHRTAMPWKIWVAFAVTLAACVVPLFVKNRIYHNVQLAANVVVLGFWCGEFLDYALILKYVSDGFVWPAGLVAIAMLVSAFIYPLFGHPQHYCNHICPLGSAQQLVAELCSYKIHITPKTLKGLDWFRRILWAVLMLCLWADCLTGWMDLELFQAFQFRSASWWIIGAACLFVALSAIVARPYCRFVCPTGSLFKRSENIG
ncbi:MAG: FMN-binding protein [Muribaculaceae bacterium]|nr:FMN-binding protein [Muribaculaceae bacterium]